MNQGDLHKVWEVKALKTKPAEDEARKILERIARQVEPIMRKRQWRVKLLSESCPTNARLLGLNVGRGVHVKLRLRRLNRDDQILISRILMIKSSTRCFTSSATTRAALTMPSSTSYGMNLEGV